MEQRVIALGFFDGVHLGHAALLRCAAAEARRRHNTAAVFTFDRPPKEVVSGKPYPQINSPDDRRWLIKQCGIREVLMVPFDREMMVTPWDRFITDILISRYHAVHLVAGYDHRFGYRNQGTPELLLDKCKSLGLGCDLIPQVCLDGTTVSSTYIRKLIALGQMERAARFLGHPHVLTGTVQHGYGLGSARLYPTANLRLPVGVLPPAYGVYITEAVLDDGHVCPSVTNVGTCPTVRDGSEVTVETSLLDYDDDLYGRTLRLFFLRLLRPERRFGSIDELHSQITRDAAATREYFAHRDNKRLSINGVNVE